MPTRTRYKKRRAPEVFSLSFLDCICCGFGAIILLFVLSKFAEPVVLEQVREDYRGIIARLEKELVEIRGETRVFNRDLRAAVEQLSVNKTRIARLQGDLSKLEGQFKGSRDDAAVQNIIEGKLADALQELTPEMQRLLRQQPRKLPDASVGGIPVDSEYIVFIIDTSGSMQRYAWPLVLQKMRETLAVYPRVKGIQVLNDMGTPMYTHYGWRWIPDSKARRQAILSKLAGWRPFSNSSPVEGITAAIRNFYDADKKISLYVFGDEFSGDDMQRVIDTVNRLNRRSADGSPRVRIHAVGFPVLIKGDRGIGITGLRFAALMRVLCHANGGTFVGLNDL